MDKNILVITAILLTVVGSVTGILGNQLSLVQAQSNEQAKIVYTVPQMRDDIQEIKQDIKILLINSRSQTNTFIEPLEP